MRRAGAAGRRSRGHRPGLVAVPVLPGRGLVAVGAGHLCHPLRRRRAVLPATIKISRPGGSPAPARVRNGCGRGGSRRGSGGPVPLSRAGRDRIGCGAWSSRSGLSGGVMIGGTFRCYMTLGTPGNVSGSKCLKLSFRHEMAGAPEAPRMEQGWPMPGRARGSGPAGGLKITGRVEDQLRPSGVAR
jgi:hypothetical protein